MSKEQFLKLGLTEQQVDDVLKELDGNFIPKPRFNEVNTELKKAKQDLEKYEDDKKQLETLRQEIKTKTEEYSQNLKSFQINTAVDIALQRANAKNLTATKSLLADFLQNAQFDGQNVVGLDDEINKMVTSQETGFMFDSSSNKMPIAGFTPGEKMDSGSETLQTGNLSDAIKLHLEQNF